MQIAPLISALQFHFKELRFRPKLSELTVIIVQWTRESYTIYLSLEDTCQNCAGQMQLGNFFQWIHCSLSPPTCSLLYPDSIFLMLACFQCRPAPSNHDSITIRCTTYSSCTYMYSKHWGLFVMLHSYSTSWMSTIAERPGFIFLVWMTSGCLKAFSWV